MGALDELCDIMRNYSGVADFVLVYVAEAHAYDEWKFLGGQFSSTLQHKTLEDRFDAATQLLTKNIPCPIYVDKMDNSASTLYAALPERLYIINNGIIEYAGGCGTRHGPAGYKPSEVKQWLSRHLEKKDISTETENFPTPTPEVCGS